MKQIFLPLMAFLTILLAFSIASANMEIPATKMLTTYEKHSAMTGKSPFRITIGVEVSGCTGGDFLVVRLQNTMPYSATYFFTLDAMTLAVVCEKPSMILSQTFEFPGSEAFVDLVVPTGAAIKIERLAK